MSITTPTPSFKIITRTNDGEFLPEKVSGRALNFYYFTDRDGIVSTFYVLELAKKLGYSNQNNNSTASLKGKSFQVYTRKDLENNLKMDVQLPPPNEFLSISQCPPNLYESAREPRPAREQSQFFSDLNKLLKNVQIPS